MQLLIVEHPLFYIFKDSLVENPNAPPCLLEIEHKLMVKKMVS